MSHPSAVALEAFALGETPAGVAGHVEGCAACAAYVARVRAEAAPEAPSRFGASLEARLDRAEASAPEANVAEGPRRLRAVAPVVITFAVAAALLLALRAPETTPVRETAPRAATSPETPLVPPGEPMRLSMLEPETRFKGGMTIAVVRERAGDQARFTGSVKVRSGDRLRLEVALDRSEAILGAVLGDDGSWLELMTEGARDAGTHLSERSARVDAAPTRGTIVVGRAEDVRRARASGDLRHAPGVTTIAIEVEER